MGRTIQRGMGAAPQSVIAVTGSLNPLRWIYDAEAYWYNVANGIQNLDGTYTAKGKQQMQDSQAAALIKASGGKMPPADAQAQAALAVKSSPQTLACPKAPVNHRRLLETGGLGVMSLVTERLIVDR